MESEDRISLNEEEIKEIYESLGSNNFQLQGKLFGDLGKNQLDIYFKSIGFATTVIGAIGLIAGFGFTALGYVKNMYVFLTAEVFLLSGLFYGLWWVQKKYQSEFNGVEQDRKKYSDFYKKRNEKFIAIFNQLVETKNISKQELKDLHELDKSSIELFENEEERTPPPIYSQVVYVLMIFGTILLLASFFCFKN